MKQFADTSVLVAGMVESHEKHAICHEWLRHVNSAGETWFVSSHSLLETFAVLTSLPLTPRMAPGTARRLVRVNVEDKANVIDIDATGYYQALDRLADEGFTGGIVYDGLIGWAANQVEADRLITLNTSDFRRCPWLDATDVVPP